MFSFHWPELLILVLLAAVFFPKRVPQIGDALGKGIRGFRRTVSQIEEETGVAEVKAIGKREMGELKDLSSREARDLRERAAIDAAPTPADPQDKAP